MLYVLLAILRSLRHRLPEMTDADLLEQYRQGGDELLMGELYKRHMHLILGVCMKYLKDETRAQDAVMDIFEKLLTELRKQEIEHFKSWLYMVAKNHCLMQLRSGQTAQKHYNGYSQFFQQLMETDGAVHLNNEDGQEDIFRLLELGLSELKPEQQDCINLFYLEGKSYQEVEQITGFNDKQVKSYIQNGKRNLKLYIERNSEQ